MATRGASAGHTWSGYTDKLSYLPGEIIRVHISTNVPNYYLRFVRVPKRSGMQELNTDAQEGHYSPIPTDATGGDCNFPESFQQGINPSLWPPGYYRVEMYELDGTANGTLVSSEYEMFVVIRSNSIFNPDADILVKLTTNTYNAYNRAANVSLYGDGALLAQCVSFNRPLQRLPKPKWQQESGWYFYRQDDDPYMPFFGGSFYTWELPFLQWAESQSTYENRIDYCVDSDLHYSPEILAPKKYTLVLSVGHDEYWSLEMRRNLLTYVSNGGNVAFFSANTCCWQVRYEGNGGRLMVCYKWYYQDDPVYKQEDKSTLTTLFSCPEVKKPRSDGSGIFDFFPENELTGVGVRSGGFCGARLSDWGDVLLRQGEVDQRYLNRYRVISPSQWPFNGTNVPTVPVDGTHDYSGFGNFIVTGYEADGCEFVGYRPVPTPDDPTNKIKDLPTPTGRDGTPSTFQILAITPAKWGWDPFLQNNYQPKLGDKDEPIIPGWDHSRLGYGVMGTWTHSSGGQVFTTGTTNWVLGLRSDLFLSDAFPDWKPIGAIVDRVTKNVLDKLAPPPG